MGILEFHFHESEFSFAPRVNGGMDADEPDDAEMATESSKSTSVPVSPSTRASDERSGSTAKKGLGVVIGLAFMIGVSYAATRLATKAFGSDDGDQLGTEKVEESIEIAD